MTAQKAKKELKKYSSKERAKINQWFFKTGKGQYGEGDKFIGVTVPNTRKVAKIFENLSLGEVKKLINDTIHEIRLLGLLILVHKYEKGDLKEKEKVVNFYLKNTKKVNNWDLVDLTAPKILGDFLIDKNRQIIHKLSESKNLWEQRISIISTWTFIREGDFEDTLRISEKLLKHEHDLIHKAVGWMLREVGKKSPKTLKDFLKKHYKDMPRTMLRYSIEKFSKNERLKYLKGIV